MSLRLLITEGECVIFFTGVYWLTERVLGTLIIYHIHLLLRSRIINDNKINEMTPVTTSIGYDFTKIYFTNTWQLPFDWINSVAPFVKLLKSFLEFCRDGKLNRYGNDPNIGFLLFSETGFPCTWTYK